MNFLAFLGGPAWFITSDLPELEQPAACDKHRELVNAAAIEAAQRKIVERGGTVEECET